MSEETEVHVIVPHEETEESHEEHHESSLEDIHTAEHVRLNDLIESLRTENEGLKQANESLRNEVYEWSQRIPTVEPLEQRVQALENLAAESEEPTPEEVSEEAPTVTLEVEATHHESEEEGDHEKRHRRHSIFRRHR